MSDSRAEVIRLAPRGAACAEIGSWKGDFAAMILAIAAPSALHLVDPWRFQPALPARWYGGLVAADQAAMDAIHDGVRARFADRPEIHIHRETSQQAAMRFAPASLDWIYIDGDHSRDAVLADLQAWLPKLKPAGHLVCDDLEWRDERGERSVAAAIEAFRSGNPALIGEALSGQFVFRHAR